MTIIAASIPVLRTLFKDITSLSKRYYLSGSNNQTQTSRVGRAKRANNTVIISGGPLSSHLNATMTNSSDKMPLRDSAGQILQSKEVMVAVEFQKRDGMESNGASYGRVSGDV